MIDLPNAIESLKARNKLFLGEIVQLEAEKAELRHRLGLDSTNSHKPLNSDGLKKKTTKPDLPKTKKNRSRAESGHRDKTLKRVASSDQIKVHLLQYHQCCGHWQLGTYPFKVMASVQYGPGVRAVVTKLPVDRKMPLAQISQLFEDMYGYALNSATLERMYAFTEPGEAHIVAQLTAKLAHFDETYVRVAGKPHWLYSVSTRTLTHLLVHEKRSTDALNADASVLKSFTGIAVLDCWSPYSRFTQARHALCGEYLLRELQGLWENGSLWTEDMHRFLLAVDNMPRPLADTEQVHLYYGLIFDQADHEELPPQFGKRGRPKQPNGCDLLNRLRTNEASLLAFAPDIPFTNNQAERELRPAKVKQKVSECFRVQVDAHVYARLQVIASTFRKQGLNVVIELRDLFACRRVALA